MNAMPANIASKGLRPKQQAFVQQYLIDLNATAAYKRAGYACKSDESAKACASRLLTNVNVLAEIQAALVKAAERSAATVSRIEQELERLALADVRKLFDADGTLKSPEQWDDDTAAAVAALECVEEFSGVGAAQRLSGYVKKVKCSEKVRALAELLKRRDLAGKGPPGSKDSPIHHVEVIRLVDPAPPSFEQVVLMAGIQEVQHEVAP